MKLNKIDEDRELTKWEKHLIRIGLVFGYIIGVFTGIFIMAFMMAVIP